MSLWLRDVRLEGEAVEIFIENGKIVALGPDLEIEGASDIIDGRGMAVVPGLYNGHSHAAMSLFRGFADDMELHSWLTEKIWPLEARLDEELVYHGARLAGLEMIRSGTVFFNDMYWHVRGTIRAAKELGLRAAVNAVMIDLNDPRRLREQIEANQRLCEEREEFGPLIELLVGPHAIYTVSRAGFEWVRDFAAEHNLKIHLHLSETLKEVEDCLRENGRRPVGYLAELGLLGENLVVAHAVWVDPHEIKLLAEHRVSVIHNPVSNMKLAVGGIFPYSRLAAAGVRIGLGTDGSASNNNLDMFENLKFAALLQKFADDDPTVLSAAEAWRMATSVGAEIFGLAGGEIAVGRPADLLLIDTSRPELNPGHNLVSDLVYAASGAVVDTTIVAGRVLMRHREIPGEAEIIAESRAAARRLLGG